MTRTALRTLSLVLSIALVLTCSLPPYDEGLSLGIETANKMVELGAEHVEVGPLMVWDFDFRDRQYYFIPNKGAVPDDLKSGFVVVVDDRSFGLSHVEFTLPDIFDFEGGWGEGIANDDATSRNFFAETIKGGSSLNFIRFDSEDYKNNEFRLILWPPAPDWEVDPPSIHPELPNLRNFIYTEVFAPDPAKWPTVIGSSITPLPVLDDLQVFFCKFDGSGNFSEVFYYTTPGTGLDVGAPILHRDDLDFNFPDDVENGFYFHIEPPIDLSFFSYYSKTQRKYKNYSWGPVGLLNPLFKMDRRIDAALTNGNLLSFENNRCYVYNSNGEKQYDFLLGGLNFCYEIDLGGIFYTVFTLPAWLSLRDREDELYFHVYALPTDLLKELQ